jgi:serine/threonine-protein kinase
MSFDPRWRRVQELIEQAERLPAPERDGWLRDHEPDPAARAEALEVLAAMEQEVNATRQRLPVDAPALPERIGPYRIAERIGAGGRSIVYTAHREVAGGIQTVALKVLFDHLISVDDLDRFQREQRILAGLNHPAICRFLDAGWGADGRPYLVLEWIDGVPIDQYCERQQLAVADRVRLIADVLDVLHAAHQCLVVHLDLKPSNILVDLRGQVRLIDFGTAKLLTDDADSTTTRQLTPRYASPEQLRGDPVSTSSDLYSVGLTLYELLAGAAAFPMHASLAALAERASGAGAAPSLPAHPDLQAMLGKALRPEPRDRYRSAAEFGDDLRAYLDGRPVRARRSTLPYRLSRFVARNQRAVATVSLLVTVLLGLAAYSFWQERQRLAEARRSAEIGRFLLWMIESSATATSGKPQLTVLEMVQRGHERIEAGLGPPDDIAAQLQSNFAYFARESGREDLAEPVARASLQRADRTGEPTPRLLARRTLAEILIRRGRCDEAVRFYDQADQLFAQDRRSLRAFAAASYLEGRAYAKLRCESDPAAAGALMEQAIALGAVLQPAETTIPPAVFRASLYNLQGLILARQRRFAEARAAVAAGLQQAESHPDGRYLRLALLRVSAQIETGAGDLRAALRQLEQAAVAAPGVVTAFEEVRLQTLIAAKLAELREPSAASRLEQAIALARRRATEIGPSFWMILADAAEVQARLGACPASGALYQEVDQLTNGKIPNDWRGNRLFFEAECAAAEEPARAAQLARQAIAVYGALLPADSTRARRLQELAAR